ncbi:calcitonin gene-related peptide type 1 receptor-like [Lingula anatina]|uniref:Calcitonin gene-related peptide type 1 receptor-like n=1 Tax=Lingula anatina TaxID=7574 RepID=A0A2R2MLS6_LINAN|nr:calcitonin gene-related peptide type 1 receptor-like [Lingula anatina]|eukprot:XP_023931012.1 calcitonin gene-related peptide type 1 receptor-like [Lingula anatina]
MLLTHDYLSKENNSNTRMEENSVGCRILWAAQLYFSSTTFAWMFCEGYYLHTLISHALSPHINVQWLYIGGWVVPVLPTLAYSIVRILMNNEQCWALSYGMTNWITDAPNLFCIVANIYFLVSIARSIKRLREHPQEESARSKRICRAVVILFLLFGLQWIIQIARLPKGTRGEAEYNVFATTVRNSQGFLVAVIFCFCNSEVQASVRDSQFWRTLRRLSRESRHSVLTQMSNLSGRSSTTARGQSVNSETARDNSLQSEGLKVTTYRPSQDSSKNLIGSRKKDSSHLLSPEGTSKSESQHFKTEKDSAAQSSRLLQTRQGLYSPGSPSHQDNSKKLSSENSKKGYVVVAATDSYPEEINEYISQI